LFVFIIEQTLSHDQQSQQNWQSQINQDQHQDQEILINQDRQSQDHQDQGSQEKIDTDKDSSSSDDDEQQLSDLETSKRHGRNDTNIDLIKRAKKINSMFSKIWITTHFPNL